MEASTLFTVVMPLHNKAPHVMRSIGSVLKQTYTNLEVLVVDDASTDGSAEEALKFSDPRIRLLRRDTPGPGGYAARNLGIAEARGEWICFLDADDEWMEDHLEKMVELAGRFPAAGFLSCGWLDVWPGRAGVPSPFVARFGTSGPREISFSEFLEFCNQYLPPTHTNVACLRNNEHARDIFPAGKAKRGGDRHAWVMYMARARVMAWSPHIGALYNRDVVAGVTHGTRSNTDLLKLLIADLSPALDAGEMALLRKYCNRRAWEAWNVNLYKLPFASFNLRPDLHWRGDVPYCLTRWLLSLIPSPAYRFARGVKRTLRGAGRRA